MRKTDWPFRERPRDACLPPRARSPTRSCSDLLCTGVKGRARSISQSAARAFDRSPGLSKPVATSRNPAWDASRAAQQSSSWAPRRQEEISSQMRCRRASVRDYCASRSPARAGVSCTGPDAQHRVIAHEELFRGT